MKVIFAGTPEFAAVALQAILDAGHSVPLVLTQPDRPAGRGLKLQASAVKQVALQHGITVAQPISLKLDGKHPEVAAAAKAQIEAQGADVMVVAAYGLILPQWTLDTPKHGCLNIHASLLPRWRGAAPIHRAIEAGDRETGITIMQMDAGLDTGAMLLKASLPIIHTGDDANIQADTTQTLHDKLAVLGGSLIQQALQGINSLEATPQTEAGVTYAAKISKAESAIDWSMDAAVIERKIRALNPAPGCTMTLNGEVVKVWRAKLSDNASTSLPLRSRGQTAAFGLEILELQKPGGKPMSWADYERGIARFANTSNAGSVLPSSTSKNAPPPVLI
jgi:methionyl-tRNA formyltransferase